MRAGDGSRIRRAGDRLAISPAMVITSSRRMEAEGVVRQVLRNAALMLLYDIGVSPRVLARWYTNRHRVPDCVEESPSSPGEADDAAGVVLAGPPDNP